MNDSLTTQRSRLVDFRKTRQLKQEEMAAQLGISGPQMSRLECGKRDPKPAFIKLFAEKYQLELLQAWHLFFD